MNRQHVDPGLPWGKPGSSSLEVHGLSRSYGDLPALRDVSFRCLPGTLTTVVGPSGSGKSTLLGVLGALDSQFEGSVSVCGRDLGALSPKEIDRFRRRAVGFIFQDYNLIEYLDGLANAALGPEAAGESPQRSDQGACVALEALGLTSQGRCLPAELSGGERQRVAVARVLAKQPQVILADEPTGSLDALSARKVVEQLRAFADDGACVVVVTHDPELFEGSADQVILMDSGRIVSIKEVDLVRGSELDADRPAHDAAPSRSRGFATLLFGHLRAHWLRSLLTGLVCAVGISGLAVVGMLLQGLQGFSDDLQLRVLSSTPLVITQDVALKAQERLEPGMQGDGLEQDGSFRELWERIASGGGANALAALGEELEAEALLSDGITSVQEVYPFTDDLYVHTADGWHFVDRWRFLDELTTLGLSSYTEVERVITAMPDNSSILQPLPAQSQDDLASAYDLKAGRFPASPSEVLLVTQPDGRISDGLSALLGLAPLEALASPDGDEDSLVIASEEVFSLELVLMQGCDYRVQVGGGWVNSWYRTDCLDQALTQGYGLKVTGIATERHPLSSGYSLGHLAYLPSLTDEMIDHVAENPLIQEQLANVSVDAQTGEALEAPPSTLAPKLLASVDVSALSEDRLAMLQSLSDTRITALLRAAGLDASTVSPRELQEAIDRCAGMTSGEFNDLLEAVAPASLDSGLAAQLATLDYFTPEDMEQVQVFTSTLEARSRVEALVDRFNDNLEGDVRAVTVRDDPSLEVLEQIHSVVMVVFIVLGAASVAVVIAAMAYAMASAAKQRTREIGCLRSLGYSQAFIAWLFMAEAALIALLAVSVGFLVSWPVMAWVESVLSAAAGISGFFCWVPAFGLPLLCVGEALCLIAALIPAFSAARKDPLSALRF